MTKPQLDDLEAVRRVVEAISDFEPADQERILRWTREKVGLAVEGPPRASVAVQKSPDAASVGGAHPAALAPSDIKSFVEDKNPTSNTQFAATVAYYYLFEAPEHLRKESITAEDLQEACRLVRRTRLARPAQTLVDTLAQGLLDRGERGSYTINTVGENLVAMALPSEGGRAVSKKPTAKKPAAKKPPTTGKGSKKNVAG